MKKIAVIGYGYVGQAIKSLLHEKYLVMVKEVDHSYERVNQCEMGVVCVPTPMKEDGTCDTSIVEKVITESDIDFFLIKSAIPPGTTDRLIKETGKRIVVSPEYIGEGKYPIPYWEGLPDPLDMKKHNFQIFGGAREDTQKMVEYFTPVLGPYCKYFQTDARTAEMVKYMENSFYATKVVFCHEFYRMARAFGIDYHELRELWLLDGRINRGSTAVMDPDNLGFGGKCLPKDINSIYQAAKEAGFNSKFLKQVIETNESLKSGWLPVKGEEYGEL